MESKLLTADRFVDPEMKISYRYVISETEFFRPHYHDYYEIFIVTGGRAIHLVNGEKFPLEKGDAVFIRPRDDHDYVRVGEERFSLLNLTFTKETAKDLYAYLGEGFGMSRLLDSKFPPSVSLSPDRYDDIMSRMGQICTVDPDEKETLRTALRIFLFRLVTDCFSSFGGADGAGEEPKWLTALCAEMEQDNNYSLGAARMEELTGKSREHIARTFKKYRGITVSDFVNNLRLKYIAGMLLHSNHSIADIILESGFENIGWASTLFKRRYGTTMLAYRNRKNG